MGQPLSNLRRRRSARTLRGFAARPTPSAPPNLSRETLINALQTVAAYITSKNQDITLIVVGDTVNTMLLRSRPNTHDVHFFNDNITPAEETAFSGKDGSTTIPFYSFSRLTILAAPWEYLFCAKVHRLSGSGISTVQLYDQDDPVHYLERYLSQHPTASVTQVTVRSWFAQYLLHWTTETELLLLAVNSTYKITSNAQHDPINLNN
ncbi:hypothetical protein N7499_008910 [Penicillium canescens]|nr:hypothetical protein N7499_008910 [Penicillium canescens]KAJ6159239.1 hypothetical protein N7485_012065 [Penicillium canescens]